MQIIQQLIQIVNDEKISISNSTVFFFQVSSQNKRKDTLFVYIMETQH
jgi:hypothetical protein